MLNYTDLVSEIIVDVSRKVEGLAHLEPDQIAVAAAARWAGSMWGNLATCITLRPRHAPTFNVWVKRRTKTIVEVSPWYRIEPARVTFGGHQARYLILLRLPRLLAHDPLETIIHELFHIGEKFDGEIRPLRHGRVFDSRVRSLMRKWLPVAEPRLAELSRLKYSELVARHGTVLARTLPGNFRSTFISPVAAPGTYREGVERLYPGYQLAADYKIRTKGGIAAPADGGPRRITEADCSIRAFYDSGSETLSPTHARYLKRAAL